MVNTLLIAKDMMAAAVAAGRSSLDEAQVTFIRSAYAGALSSGREANAANPNRWVVRPLTVVEAALGRVAAGDLTVRTGLTRGDELGRLGRALDATAQALRTTVGKVTAHARSLSTAAQRLSTVSRQMSAVRRRRPVCRVRRWPRRPRPCPAT